MMSFRNLWRVQVSLTTISKIPQQLLLYGQDLWCCRVSRAHGRVRLHGASPTTLGICLQHHEPMRAQVCTGMSHGGQKQPVPTSSRPRKITAITIIRIEGLELLLLHRRVRAVQYLNVTTDLTRGACRIGSRFRCAAESKRAFHVHVHAHVVREYILVVP